MSPVYTVEKSSSVIDVEKKNLKDDGKNGITRLNYWTDVVKTGRPRLPEMNCKSRSVDCVENALYTLGTFKYYTVVVVVVVVFAGKILVVKSSHKIGRSSSPGRRGRKEKWHILRPLQRTSYALINNGVVLYAF